MKIFGAIKKDLTDKVNEKKEIRQAEKEAYLKEKKKLNAEKKASAKEQAQEKGRKKAQNRAKPASERAKNTINRLADIGQNFSETGPRSSGSFGAKTGAGMGGGWGSSSASFGNSAPVKGKKSKSNKKTGKQAENPFGAWGNIGNRVSSSSLGGFGAASTTGKRKTKKGKGKGNSPANTNPFGSFRF